VHKSEVRSPSRLLSKAFETFKRKLTTISGAEGGIARLNRERGPVEVSTELRDFLRRVEQLMKETQGRYEPRLGELAELWSSGADTAVRADSTRLVEAMKRALATEIVLLDDGRVQLTGRGRLAVQRAGIGWAVDGAAETLMRGEVASGVVSAAGIWRVWGRRESGDKWQVLMDSPEGDTLQYRIEPDDGALCLVKSASGIADARLSPVIDPASGRPAGASPEVVIWAADAVSAVAYAEAALALDRDAVFGWLDQRDDIGVLYFYHDPMGCTAEADPRMSNWFNSYLP